jgi:signal peptidase II
VSPRARPWRLAAALCGAVVALDQGAKALVESNLVPGETIDLALGFQLTDVHNEGIAFGLGGGDQTAVIVLTLVALTAIGVLFLRVADRQWAWVAVGLAYGGALGNLADRVRIDSVTDFIDPPLWPAFNLADIAITIGVAGLALVMLAEDGG